MNRPKSPKPLQDWLYDEIKNAVLDLRIEPGERIKIESLAQEFGVSRTPIREVLQRLSTEGMVRLIPRVGPVASGMNLKEMNDLYAVRKCLETLATKNAIEHVSKKHLMQMEGILKRTKVAIQEGDAKKIRILNRDFHGAIFQLCDNRHLMKHLEDVFNKLQRYLNVLSREDTVRISATEHHDRIFRSLADRDRRSAEKHLNEHLGFVRESLERVLRSKYPMYLEEG